MKPSIRRKPLPGLPPLRASKSTSYICRNGPFSGHRINLTDEGVSMVFAVPAGSWRGRYRRADREHCDWENVPLEPRHGQ